jgi:GNAT superfamily N-acetyltransferase
MIPAQARRSRAKSAGAGFAGAGAEIELRVVTGRPDLELWVEVKNRVVPNEPTTPEQIATSDEPGRLLLLAERDGLLAGCGIVTRSQFGDRVFVAARVLREHRRRGVGRELVRALAEHGRALGRNGINAFVEEDDSGSLAFADGFGLREVDYQLEQVRVVGSEPRPVLPDGVELVSLAGRRKELLEAAWPVAEEGYSDMPLPEAVSYPFATWLRDEATRPDGSFVAYADGEIVGYAGLIEHANGPAAAEHGLTTVRRDRRRRGVARALKLAQLHWASANGVVELVTWTQKGNEAMQALNASLGYETRSRVLTMQGPLGRDGDRLARSFPRGA